ncbi:ZP3 protein, partial [Amia calva]|nr:ZP3 protein [Amia calva]
MVEMVNDCFLTQFVREPTRESACIDLIFSNDQDRVRGTVVREPMANCDHNMVVFEAFFQKTRSKSKTMVYNFRKANLEGMRRHLEEVDWSTLDTELVENAWVYFKNILLEAQEQFVPKLSKLRNKKHWPKWYNRGMQIINGRLVYSNTLRYSPPTSSHPVIRGVSFTVPIQLVYNRFHYSYKIGYQPTFPQHGSTLPGMDKSAFFRELKNRHGYILVTTNEQWIRLSPKNIYYLGQPMYFQATGYFATEGQRLFIQSCYATASPDRHSKPRFTVIDNFGCLVDSKADGCQSRFVPYTRKDVLRFTIDAFLFQKTLSEHVMTELYMHCTMTVAQHVTPGTKSCTYNRKAKRWEELYGNHAVCTCCDSRCAGDRAEGGCTGAMNLASVL